MEKKKLKLNILIIILVVLVIGLLGYIVYDKIPKENDNEVIDNNDNLENEKFDNTSIIEEIKTKFDFVFEYSNSVVAYCGIHEPSDKVAESGNYYNFSTQFKSYDEMFNYLKKYMSDDIITSVTEYTFANAANKDNYIEDNNKLYCATFGKGNLYDYGDSVIEINSNDGNIIKATAVKELINKNGESTYEKVNLTLTKVDNNYIITSYES